MISENVIQQKHCQLEPNERERGENKRRLSDTQNSTGRNQVDNTTSLKYIYPSGMRKDDSNSGATGPEGGALSHPELFWGLETSWSWPSGFQDGLGLVPSFLLSFSLYCDGNCYNCSPVPNPPLHLGANNWLSSFTRTQMERNLALIWVTPRISPIPDVDDKEETWTYFGLELIW